MTGDMRVTAAREYLDAIRPHKVTTRPPSVLARECQELRHHLGQILDVIDGHAAALATVAAAPQPWRAETAARLDALEDRLDAQDEAWALWRSVNGGGPRPVCAVDPHQERRRRIAEIGLHVVAAEGSTR